MSKSIPTWYVCLQVVLLIQGVLMVSFGVLMSFRRLKMVRSNKAFSTTIHTFVHHSLISNGIVFIFLALDPVGVIGIWPFWLLPGFRALVNVLFLNGLLFWTSILVGGLKDAQGLIRDVQKLQLYLWKLPSFAYILACLSSWVLAISQQEMAFRDSNGGQLCDLSWCSDCFKHSPENGGGSIRKHPSTK
jgi:hypothetical protein